MHGDQVRCWSEQVTIPTYRIGEPNKNPMFLEKRVYQGSSGVVYPYPVIDRVYDEKEDKEYTAVFLENRYLRLMVLPEIGGRLQMAVDKTNDYHFVYYNRVIKPALVGLAGPWISGGIEFNWPQHHRPTTFSPVEWRIEEEADGSQTIWCAEIEPMFRTKGMHGFTLRPDRAYFEVNVQLNNRTSEPQTFLWWANPAVAVSDEYQSIFPPDVHAVMDHGKRDVSDFPIATGTYYKVNYAPGTDISRYKNIPVPTSYMAYHSDFDFVGCYDHGRQAGMMHVANHHVVPGKKQWTWGCGDFGRSWDRQLTDEDGPYIELMCGAYTDNQPDFSWLQPGEEKRFSQIFMPYKDIGGAKNASREVVVNLEAGNGEAFIGVYVTRPREVVVTLEDDGQPIYEKEAALDPETTLLETVQLPAGSSAQALTLRVTAGGRELIAFSLLPDEKPNIPEPAAAAKAPGDMGTIEELYLQGLHLEQYRHATYAPEPYYEEGLRRDPGDSRCNNALGLLLYRRGKFADAEVYFRRAIERITKRNPNPYDGEPFYNLGLALRMQGRFDEATDAFYKAVWNCAWQGPAYFELARLAARGGHFEETLSLVENALAANGRFHKARHLQTAVLRHMSRQNEALATAAASLGFDALEYGALWEQHLLTGDTTFERLTEKKADILIELALDYGHAGLFEDAAHLLNQAQQATPMLKYTLGWIALQAGEVEEAERAFAEAAVLPADYVFPNRLEDVLSLSAAMEINAEDARAPYYLGNFWFAHRRYGEAIACWEQARRLDGQFPTVHRNLGLAYFNKLNEPQRALESLELAFSLDEDDARVLFELDQLYKKLNYEPGKRLAFLEEHADLVEQRDDLVIERITLLNLQHEPRAALDLIMGRNFHPWEGGEGKVTRQYVVSLLELARDCIGQGQYGEANDLLERAQVYPHNLGEGKLYGAQENDIFYNMGCAYEGAGENGTAREWFAKATKGLSEPTSAMFYNDQPPDMIFYQGLAQEKLGRTAEAREIFEKLVDYGERHMNDEIKIDYFAISLPDFLVFEEDLDEKNRVHCHYMIALGKAGLGEYASAQQQFEEVLRLDKNHLGAVLHKQLVSSD